MDAGYFDLSVCQPSPKASAGLLQFWSERVSMARAESLHCFEDLLRSLGGDVDAALKKAGADRSLLQRGDIRVPHSQLMELLEVASAQVACPDFGMRLAASQSALGVTKVLGPLEVAMRNSPTLEDAYRYCSEFLHGYDDATQLCIEQFPDDARTFMLLDTILLGGAHQRQGVEHALSRAQSGVHALSGGQVRPREIWFTHEPLAPLSSYRAHFKTTVRFGQSITALLFDGEDLKVPLIDAEPQLYEIATHYIERRLQRRSPSLRLRVRIHVARLLLTGDCTHHYVATALGMHRRTMQRRLRQEGASFESVRDDVRRELALRYLQQPDVSLLQLTGLLGYSETSVLSRSCLRWFLASPTELRAGLRR